MWMLTLMQQWAGLMRGSVLLVLESRSTLWRLKVTERDSAYPNLFSLSSIFPHEKASTTSLLSPGLSIYKRSR
ncbi:hypothetical protein LWI28_004542 [Acer negundo]|uniref:Secreted protein n=1 Tax=Acer negundo TaxID=4023 RepID=A0AAD5IYM4_ACENE|nr:hypothetical protein LWI28_004542 [Acer negundo]